MCVFGGEVVGGIWSLCRFHCLDWSLPQFAFVHPHNPDGLRDGECLLSVSARSWWVGWRCVRQLGCRCIGNSFRVYFRVSFAQGGVLSRGCGRDYDAFGMSAPVNKGP